MNTKPDDTTLALWLDDELDGEAHAQVEAWAAENPEHLASREEIRRWRKMIGESIPAAEEPPASEFFNERIQHAIRSETEQQPVAGEISGFNWSSLWMPLAACAGMALAFWLGVTSKPTTPANAAGNLTQPAATSPHIYTPEQGVDAEWIDSGGASATVIVLNGITAIPDTVDFTAVNTRRPWREIDSTAAIKNEAPSE